MFIILYYDVDKKRCNKMLKACRKYLNHVQNSVLEGEISDAGFEALKTELKGIMKSGSQDSLVIYQFQSMKYSKRIVLGEDKKGDTQIF